MAMMSARGTRAALGDLGGALDGPVWLSRSGDRISPDGKGDCRATIERLRSMLERHGGTKARKHGGGGREKISTGIRALDEVLPRGGLPAGAVIEVLSAEIGVGARTLALRAAMHAAGGVPPHLPLRASVPSSLHPFRKSVVVVDCDGDFYPPGAAAMGMRLDRLLVVRVRNAADAFWAVEQSLRCEAVAAVVATRLPLDELRSRRLQLAAESSGSIGLIVAPAGTRRHTFAAVRLLVEGEARRHEGTKEGYEFDAIRRCRITVLKVREGSPVEPIVTGLSEEWGEGRDETFDVPLHSTVADRSVATGPWRLTA